jgi:hypothetical protein
LDFRILLMKRTTIKRRMAEARVAAVAAEAPAPAVTTTKAK